MYLALGQAVARAQEVEVVMVRLLEQQRQDTSLPLDDRWDEISAWLGMTAGSCAICWAFLTLSLPT